MKRRQIATYALAGVLAALIIFLAYVVYTNYESASLYNEIFIRNEQNIMGTLQLTSPAFQQDQMMPALYTCQGRNINPRLIISGTPAEAKSLALIVDDPDAPAGVWDHWLMWNMTPDITEIAENSVPLGAVQGKNSWGKAEYGGPCPPAGTHRYRFTIIALSEMLPNLPAGSDKSKLLYEIRDKILDQYTLVGLYRKS